jgi:hypothetical protein
MINGFRGCQQNEGSSRSTPLPDLAPSNFVLFEDVKRQLSGCSFDGADDLLIAIQAILDGFERPTLIRIFGEWVRRLEQCIEP